MIEIVQQFKIICSEWLDDVSRVCLLSCSSGGRLNRATFEGMRVITQKPITPQSLQWYVKRKLQFREADTTRIYSGGVSLKTLSGALCTDFIAKFVGYLDEFSFEIVNQTKDFGEMRILQHDRESDAVANEKFLNLLNEVKQISYLESHICDSPVSVVKSTVSKFPRLTGLTIDVVDVCSALNEIANTCQQLRYFRISSFSHADESFIAASQQDITKLLQNNKELMELSLTAVPLNEENMKSLGSSLTRLRCKFQQQPSITPVVFIEFLSRTRLKYLHIAEFRAPPINIWKTAVMQLRTLETLSLHLSNSGAHEMEVVELCHEVALQCTTLQQLIVFHSNGGGEIDLVDTFAHLPLTEVECEGLKTSSKYSGRDTMLAASSSAVKLHCYGVTSYFNYKRLSSGVCEVTHIMPYRTPMMQVLHELQQVVPPPSVTELNIMHNFLQSVEAKRMAEKFPNVSVLKLCTRLVVPETIEALIVTAEAWKPQLTYIAGHALSNEPFVDMVIQHLPRIRTIDLQDLYFLKDEHVERLCTAFGHQLQGLKLVANPGLTRKTLSYVVILCPNLTLLDVRTLWHMKADEVREIVTNCAEITELFVHFEDSEYDAIGRVLMPTWPKIALFNQDKTRMYYSDLPFLMNL